MYKKSIAFRRPRRYLFKLLLTMKLVAVLLIVTILQAGAKSYAQKVTINVKQASIASVLDQIQQQTGYDFLYNSTHLQGTKTVDLHFRNASLNEVLEACFSGQPLTYEIENTTVLIHRKKISTPVPDTEILQREISGRVTDHQNQPLEGVTVAAKGTHSVTTTDRAGRFSLSVPQQATTLVFTLVGFEPQEHSIGTSNNLNVSLSPSLSDLDEVVVIGYGSVKKSDVTGAIGSVDRDAIVRTANIQAAGAIQGQVAGVNLLKVNGKPGDDYSIEIRGLNSIGKGNAPLVVIDGVMGGSLSSLNPADIEKIDVLKDASATAIYGSRGSNGVIIVTTRQGAPGKNRIAYDGYVGMKTPTNLPDMMDGPQFVANFNEILKNGGTRYFDDKEKQNIENGVYTDWIDLLLQNGMQSSHNISLSGGNESSRHFFSAGYLKEEGNVPAEEFSRFTLKSNIDGKINSWINAGTSTYVSYGIQDQGSNEALRGAYRLRPTGDAYDENGELLFWPTTSDSQTPNPLFDPLNVKNETRNFRVFGNLFVEVNLLDGLSFRSTISPYFESVRSGNFAGKYSKANTGTRNGSGGYSNQLNFSYTLDNVLSYNKSVKSHSFGGILANSIVSSRGEGAAQDVLDLPYDSFWYNTGSAGNIEGVSSYLTEWALLSYMGRFNYSFNDKYQLTLTGRADGSSKLAAGHKWAFFPSAAIAWRVSEEEFLRDVKPLSNLKLRLSYGVVGNDAVAPYSTQASILQTLYDWGGDAALGFAPGAIANKSLGWEKSKEINLGIDFGFLKNRISGSVDIYSRKTEDLILSRALPQHTGFGAITANVGSTANKGVEVALNTVNIHTSNFSWKTTLTFAKNHNEIVELYGDQKDDIGNKWFIGQPIQVHYAEVFDGIWQLDEAEEAAKYGAEPGHVKVKDLNEDGQITEVDRQIIGSPLPKWIGGMTNTFAYKGVDFSFMLYSRQGSMIYSPFHHSNFAREWNGRYNKLNVNYWTETNPSNEWPAPNNTGGRGREELKAYVDASFVRVQNITLGYSFSPNILSRLKMSGLRLYLTANNPLIFTDYAGFDPEWSGQNTFNMGISSATYLFGANISF
ncbi:TonB-linked outer membrane protein, SusC/RagA family [Parapedobacter indicus]|uniref:TonB-linked outer membrane protein, SusC/RagA family n=2 Tax=Parapedobacter indicus TaxID=1477437 RepID=A0A1I3K0B3_9SPHI|nr:TonB-linked SusC/RagA family outer membrane protein [Parapedobacter indicus]SFI65876.1 TonB-linked outer membrane protein, SusC/RagA family [Parapedobacter indicus]